MNSPMMTNPADRPMRPSHRPRRNQNTVSGIMQKDPFGILIFVILFAAALIVKWWVLSPSYVESGNCVACVVTASVVMAVLSSFLLMAFWIFWSDRFPLGMGFYFSLIGMGLVCALLYHKLSRIVISKLYYSGNLNWVEAQASDLLDQLVYHNAGLYLAVLVAYISIRMLFVRAIDNKLPVITTSLALLGTASLLLFIGLKMY